MHDLHKAMGSLFFYCSVLHAAAHVARWTLRLELSALSHSVGSSGTVALLLLVLSVAPMYRAGMFRRLFSCSFEIGHWLHLCAVPILIALCFHHANLRACSAVLLAVWGVDRSYLFVRRTRRI